MTERQLISEPERIRALAHPLRLELIDHLNDVGEATATQCAEHTGESVASCSFHLRMLAKYGYIEPAQRRGREKPWKLIHATRDMRPSPDVPGSLAAVVELGVIGVLRESERIREYLVYAQQEDQEWIEASTLCMSDFWVTREEMAEISATLAELAQRYLPRNSDPELRPEGARKSRLFGVVNPDPRKRKESEVD